MNTVPNIITNKDMLLLEDLFNKNYNLFKMIELSLNEIKNEEIKELVTRVKNLHEDYMYFTISSLKKENYFEEDIDE